MFNNDPLAAVAALGTTISLLDDYDALCTHINNVLTKLANAGVNYREHSDAVLDTLPE